MHRAASLAEKLLNKHQNKIGEVAMMPSGGGAFEVSVGDEKVYSKLETGRFPNESSLIKELGQRL